ncbi:hypothetical protein BB31_41570 [Amycolatopsis lurida NRRL 2430]|uniref:Uncharacterized protein n=2 Tax=Amycolatopsis lurida TaxID=31959 RepID=A0A2P2FFD4_AMYLU|nr:hypothetical protein BB31_41570 [Amycolatopsis lurida NRRL 2430]
MSQTRNAGGGGYAADRTGGRGPVRLFFRAASGRYQVPLKDGRHTLLTPEELADRLAATPEFQRMAASAMRPLLAVTTCQDYAHPGDRSLDEAFVAKLIELTGPWQVTTPPPLNPADLRYIWADDRVASHDTAPAHYGHQDFLVLAMKGTETSARVERPDGKLIDLDGTALGTLLLGDTEFRSQLTQNRAVVLDTGATDVRVGYGGLGFDLAGALRAENFFNDVHVRDAGGTLTLVSVPRAGDLQTTVITGPAGARIGKFVRFSGDTDALARVRRWAAKDQGAPAAYLAADGRWAVTPWPRRPVILFARRSETGYRAIRGDGQELDLLPEVLAHSLCSGPGLHETGVLKPTVGVTALRSCSRASAVCLPGCASSPTHSFRQAVHGPSTVRRAG